MMYLTDLVSSIILFKFLLYLFSPFLLAVLFLSETISFVMESTLLYQKL